MIMYKSGDRVRFTNADKHELLPMYYPPVGTIGVVIKTLYRIEQLKVMWAHGTTPEDEIWWCDISDIESVKGENENTVNRSTYLCYEKNRGEIACENGDFEILKSYFSIDKSVGYVMDRIKQGTDDGFVVDAECGDVSRDKLYNELSGSGRIDITLFNGYQENWDVSYDVIVQRVEVEE